MSNDKHRNKDLKTFVLANLPIYDRGRPGYRMRGTRPEIKHPNDVHCNGRSLDVTKVVKELEKDGLIKRKRNNYCRNSNITKLIAV